MGRVFQILLVEDHLADVTLTRKAFARLATPNALHVAVDGFEAMSFLRREATRFASAPRPDLVLLDLNMPRKDGRTLLRELRADASLRSIPVVVLTTSSAATDVRMAYELGANGYVAKPASYADFVLAVESIERFWLNTALLP